MSLTLLVPTDLNALLDPERATEARRAVRENLSNALALLGQGRTNGDLTLAGQSRLFEEILGEIDDPDNAAELVNQNIDAEAAAEMIAVRGDLASVASTVVDADIIMAALLEDATESPALLPLLIKAWAIKLLDRSDWEELLEREIGKYTLLDYLIAAIAAEDEDPSADQWVDVGLDPNDAMERLEELRDEKTLPKFSADDAEDAMEILRERRRTFDKTPTIAEAAAAAASQVEI